MKKIGTYEKELYHMSPRKWEGFLKKHSNLPGQANLNLARAFAHTATLMDFKKYIALGPEKAMENTPDEFLTICGVLGYGQYLSGHHDGGLMLQLKGRANDPRWRIREAVSTALRLVGSRNMQRLLEYARSWGHGSLLEQRAAITAVCNAELLIDKEVCLEALELLEWVTATLLQDKKQSIPDYKTLEEALGYCWSILVAACPEKGKAVLERWMKENHPAVNRILKENLSKKRLQQMDPVWTRSLLEELNP